MQPSNESSRENLGNSDPIIVKKENIVMKEARPFAEIDMNKINNVDHNTSLR